MLTCSVKKGSLDLYLYIVVLLCWRISWKRFEVLNQRCVNLCEDFYAGLGPDRWLHFASCSLSVKYQDAQNSDVSKYLIEPLFFFFIKKELKIRSSSIRWSSFDWLMKLLTEGAFVTENKHHSEGSFILNLLSLWVSCGDIDIFILSDITALTCSYFF